MRKGHEEDAKASQSENAATSDPDIKGLVDNSLPTVEGHLAMITAMKK